MKVVIAGVFVLISVVILAFGGLFTLGTPNAGVDDFLRFHIRANSNTASDQEVKYLIKQEILNQFTPIFSGVTSREMAMTTLGGNISRLERIANNVLHANGKSYTARAFLRSEYFPMRTYHGFTLPAGNYDALIIELGLARGENWWCVVYPPLCFLDNNIGGERGVVYRSRLHEIIRRFQ
ncbi:MAG: stage II sporulation protein R [Firmicutes bacterium]|nr:stage II sporulation protein R [Bacillota bacterium]